MRGIKRLIDEGYDTTLGEGQALEARVSREWARDVRPEAVAERRRVMQTRAREQQR